MELSQAVPASGDDRRRSGVAAHRAGRTQLRMATWSCAAKVHRMSPERVREEMTYFVTHDVSSMILADANFGIVESDVAVAELMAELNSQHGRPIKYLGVNYAKNSGDRVLEIAATLRRGGIHTSTTLALQSVTPEAEKTTRRYSV